MVQFYAAQLSCLNLYNRSSWCSLVRTCSGAKHLFLRCQHFAQRFGEVTVYSMDPLEEWMDELHPSPLLSS